MSSASSNTATEENCKSSIEEFGKLIELRNAEFVEMKKSAYYYVSPDGSKILPMVSEFSAKRLEELKSLTGISRVKYSASASQHGVKKYKPRFPFKPAQKEKQIINPFRSVMLQKFEHQTEDAIGDLKVMNTVEQRESQ